MVRPVDRWPIGQRIPIVPFALGAPLTWATRALTIGKVRRLENGESTNNKGE